ncbi:HEAT repeat domain-containing protein [bacterium]|nr:HEAT repeat domain-containing protein [bacterium]
MMARTPQFADNAASLAALADFINVVCSASVNIHRYPTNSTIVSNALSRAEALLGGLLLNLPSVTLTENERYLQANEEVLPQRVQFRPQTRTFLAMMHTRNIHSITFHQGVTRDELASMFRILGAMPEELHAGGISIEERIAAEGIRHIAVDEVFFVRVTRSGALGAHHAEHADEPPKSDPMIAVAKARDGRFLDAFMTRVLRTGPWDAAGADQELREAIGLRDLRGQDQIDFEDVGATLATSLNRWLGLDRVDLARAGGNAKALDLAERMSAAPVRRLTRIFAEMFREAAAERDIPTRRRHVRALDGLVGGMHPFVIANFFAESLDAAPERPVKRHVLKHISTFKKGGALDAWSREAHRLLDGLNPDDFAFDRSRMLEIEATLILMKAFAEPGEKRELGLQLQLAAGNIHLLSITETEADFLALKVKRLMARPAADFANEDFLDHFANMAAHLIAHADGAKPMRVILNHVGANLSTQDEIVRAAALEGMRRMAIELAALGGAMAAAEAASIVARAVAHAHDREFSTIAAAQLGKDLRLLIEEGRLEAAVRIFGAIDSQRDAGTPEGRELLDGIFDGLARDTHTLQLVIERWTIGTEQESEASAHLLARFDQELVLPHLLAVLKDSDERRVRKRCTMYVTQLGDAAVSRLVEELRPENPWYYNRNLISILGDIGRPSVATAVLPYLDDPNEAVARAAVQALAHIGGEGPGRELLERLGDQPPSLQRVILAQIGKDRLLFAVPKLVDFLRTTAVSDENLDLVCAVVKTLGQIGDRAAGHVIAPLLKKKGLFARPNDELVVAALIALGRICENQYADDIRAYLNHSNPTIAQSAKFALDRLRGEPEMRSAE